MRDDRKPKDRTRNAAGGPRKDAIDPAYARHQFTETDEKVEPEEWLVPPSDRNRQFSRLPSIQVPPYMMLAMEKIVGSKRFPYEVMADFIRHGLARHIEWIARTDGMFDDHLLVLLRGMAALRHEEVLKREAMTTLTRLEHTMERLLQDGDKAQAFKLAVSITRLIDKMPASATKNKFTRRFQARYAGFMRTGGAVMPDAGAGYLVDEADLAAGLDADLGGGDEDGDGGGGRWSVQ
jgi:hypothetical protein